MGDELSTLFVVQDRSFLEVISTVASNAEISPPVYFALAWFTTNLGSAPELLRLPALIAGTALIPMTYLTGLRAVGRTAGVVTAAAMALNPFMIFYATDARAYTVAIALLLGSTLAMLAALRTGGKRWWLGYAAASCLAVLTHYTAAFVLLGQLLWLLWAHPAARRPALASNVAAAIAFLPWLPSALRDFDSPTVEILSILQGDGFETKLRAVESWLFGYPFNLPERVPGNVPLAIGAAGLVVGGLAGLWHGRSVRAARPAPAGEGVARGTVLVFVLALATPVAEAGILLLGGSDLFGARNLNTASGGMALSVGAMVAASGAVWGSICAAAVLGVFAVGAAKSLETTVSTIDFKSAAEYIDANAGPDDVVLDIQSPVVTPVPLTPLDVYLPQTRAEYRGYLPDGPPPFLEVPPPPRPIVAEAFRAAGRHRVFVVAAESAVRSGEGGESPIIVLPPPVPGEATRRFRPPGGSRVVAEVSYPGLGAVNVFVIESGDRDRVGVSPDAAG